MTYLMIAFNLVILLKGVQKGIEKVSNVMMPVLFLLLLVFAGVAMTFPKAFRRTRVLPESGFLQDYSRVVINALGQAFFSLSLGMGILITYSGYFPKEDQSCIDGSDRGRSVLLVAILMGFIIFQKLSSLLFLLHPRRTKWATGRTPTTFYVPHFWQTGESTHSITAGAASERELCQHDRYAQ